MDPYLKERRNSSSSHFTFTRLCLFTMPLGTETVLRMEIQLTETCNQYLQVSSDWSRLTNDDDSLQSGNCKCQTLCHGKGNYDGWRYVSNFDENTLNV
jgi:hypothetical protein